MTTKSIDGYVDKTGYVSIFSRGEPPLDQTCVCFDVRKMYGLGLSREKVQYDLRMLFAHDGELSSLAKSRGVRSAEQLLSAEKRFSAHTKAISEAKMDITKVPLHELVPSDVLDEYMQLRLFAVEELWDRLTPSEVQTYEQLVWPVFQDILQVESSKVKVDTGLVETSLKDMDLAVHERKFLQHMLGVTKDGFARTKISPVGSKTWRLRVEGGLNCMAIPHGVCRQAIVSRFPGGSIVSLDFNAIDYRSLVDAVNDPELNAIYGGKEDFHRETATLFGDVTKELRDLVKKITYSHIYGSSLEGLQKTTGLPKDRLSAMLTVLDRRFAPIGEFRKNLAEQSRRSGFLITPGHHRVEIDPKDHDGKIVGLFAQTYSSYVLNRALHAVLAILGSYPDNGEDGAMSRVIFTVHDEIIFDVHPAERRLIDLLARTVKAVTGFSVKIREGKSYGEATD